MRKTGIILILSLSIILNIILGILLIFNQSHRITDSNSLSQKDSSVERQKKAEEFVKELVCENLFYPMSYDPVRTRVDSVFMGH